MSSPWIDVSVPLSDGMVHWPGDPEVRITRAFDLERGDPATVSHLDMGAHTGTHIDAPAHYLRGGAALDTLPFGATVGEARVIGIADPVSIKADELAAHRIDAGERILFKTRNSSRQWAAAPFDESFVFISHEAARYLAQRRVATVGVDYLSVGGFRQDGEATHIALLTAGVWIIEGLDLSAVAPGRYELVCLPLRLVGAEGAPARAVLRRLP